MTGGSLSASKNEYSSSLSNDLRFLWLRKWLIIALVFVFAGGAFAYANSKPRLYTATAKLMYDQQASTSSLISGRTTDTTTLSLELQSVINTINSADVTTRAHQALKRSKDYSADTIVSAAIIVPESDALMSNQVGVSATSTKAASTEVAANAYARAIIETRVERQRAQLRKARRTVESQLRQFRTPESKSSADYYVLAQRLRELTVAEQTTTGDFVIVQPANTPAKPFSPRPLRSTLIGLILGLGLGVGLAYLLSQLDTKLRSNREVSELLGLPVLGRIPLIPEQSLKERDLISLTAPESQAAESFRVLRSNLDWLQIDGKLKPILITSSEKGEGKTFTICNIAITLALAGKAVGLIDADLRAPRVHKVFNIPNKVGLSSVIGKSAELSEAVQPFDLTFHGTQKEDDEATSDEAPESLAGSLEILTAGPHPPNPGELVASQHMAAILQHLAKSKVDYLLLDAPPLLVTGDVSALAASLGGVIYVTNIKTTRRPLLKEAREALDALPCRKLGVVVVGEKASATNYKSYGYS